MQFWVTRSRTRPWSQWIRRSGDKGHGRREDAQLERIRVVCCLHGGEECRMVAGLGWTSPSKGEKMTEMHSCNVGVLKSQRVENGLEEEWRARWEASSTSHSEALSVGDSQGTGIFVRAGRRVSKDIGRFTVREELEMVQCKGYSMSSRERKDNQKD